jgi:hypothetical protein
VCKVNIWATAEHGTVNPEPDIHSTERKEVWKMENNKPSL